MLRLHEVVPVANDLAQEFKVANDQVRVLLRLLGLSADNVSLDNDLGVGVGVLLKQVEDVCLEQSLVLLA